MANDPPTNLRMGFGYHQARVAGLGGIRESRSPRQVNRYINERKTVREATAWLRDEVKKDAEWSPFVQHWISEGCNAQEVMQSLANAQFDVWWRRKRNGPNRYFAPF
jgi:hypothetical protein